MGSDPLDAPAGWGANDRLAMPERGGDPACWLPQVCPHAAIPTYPVRLHDGHVQVSRT